MIDFPVTHAIIFFKHNKSLIFLVVGAHQQVDSFIGKKVSEYNIAA